MGRTVTTNRGNFADIFSRLWDPGNGGLTPAIARHLLRLRFSDADVARMHELAARNQAGHLTPEDLQELDNFIQVGDALAILQSKARKLLKSRLA